MMIFKFLSHRDGGDFRVTLMIVTVAPRMSDLARVSSTRIEGSGSCILMGNIAYNSREHYTAEGNTPRSNTTRKDNASH
jgi:hypothetical protein